MALVHRGKNTPNRRVKIGADAGIRLKGQIKRMKMEINDSNKSSNNTNIIVGKIQSLTLAPKSHYVGVPRLPGNTEFSQVPGGVGRTLSDIFEKTNEELEKNRRTIEALVNVLVMKQIMTKDEVDTMLAAIEVSDKLTDS